MVGGSAKVEGEQIEVDGRNNMHKRLSATVQPSRGSRGSETHGSVGRRLVTVSLDLHATGDTGDGLLARHVGDVDEGVVE